jgi:pimeloyl-ACP methyl ester carboxylesterase
MQLVVDTLLTNCELSGKGDLIVLLHGWGDSALGFKDMQAELSKHYKTLAIDLPGFGSSEAPKEVWDLDNYAQFTADVIKKLEFKQPYALIGHSNGGAVAIKAVSLGLIAPRRLILIAASGIRKPLRARRLLLAIVAKTGNLATLWMPNRYREALRKSLYHAAGSDMLVTPELEETFKKTVRQDVTLDARKIVVPTLLIYAQRDPAVPSGSGERYAELMENAKLEVIEGAGHFVHHDQPEQVLKIIRGFLS